MHRLLAIALVLVSSLAASVAAADPKPTPNEPPPMSTDDCAKATAAHRRCELDLKPEDLEGHKPVNQGVDTSTLTFAKMGSLLHIRRDFIQQIIKSADELD
jgi:hypothetical protein